MTLYGYVFLLGLLLYTSASYQQVSKGDFYLDVDDLRRELKDVLRNLDNNDDFNDHLHGSNQDSRSVLESFPATKRRSSHKRKNEAPTVSLMNVTVIHRGFYFATARINFLRNGLQDEFETDSFFDGTNKVFALQKNPSDVITYVRIRFHVVGGYTNFGDFQVIEPKNQTLCFVLSGIATSPVYSICAPDENYFGK